LAFNEETFFHNQALKNCLKMWI